MRDGADAETVVCALFHDVGEVLNHVNHGEIGETLVCFDHIHLGIDDHIEVLVNFDDNQ